MAKIDVGDIVEHVKLGVGVVLRSRARPGELNESRARRRLAAKVGDERPKERFVRVDFGKGNLREVWIAADFRAGTFRTRREALKHCPPGLLPRLVKVTRREGEDRSPGGKRWVPVAECKALDA